MKRLQVVPWSPVPSEGDAALGDERRSAIRRAAEQAIDTAVVHGLWVIGLLGLALWARIWPLADPAPASHVGAGLMLGLLVLWLGLTLAWLLIRPRLRPGWADKRHWWPAWLWLARLNLLMPALQPWLAMRDGQFQSLSSGALSLALRLDTSLPQGSAADPAWPLALLAGCIAALPMQPALARLAGVALLSSAAAALLLGAPVALVLLPVIAAALGWLASAMAARRWHTDTRARIDAADRLNQVTAERNAARRADEDKRRFVAAASHDLRQPMHALGLFAATLERHLQGSVDEALARNMIRSVEALDRSFSALLDLSRLEAGTVQPNVQRFPLRDLFRRLHMHFAGQAEELGLGLRFSAGGKAVSSDPQLLERILANLIQNALRYTRSGGVAVVARSNARQLKLEVWDSGCGITEADLPRVFDEFYRVPDSARGDVQGLGMGLAIVKRLVALLGHTLEVASAPGRGTMFRIGITTGSMAEVEDATAAADTIPAPVLEARCVLLIDDEASIREGLHMLLTEWGFEPVAVADLAGARQAATELGSRLDLVISDLHLRNGEDGLAVIQCVRDVCARAVPAILVTGDTSPAEIRRASASGHMVLFKPVQPSKLFGVLRSLV